MRIRMYTSENVFSVRRYVQLYTLCMCSCLLYVMATPEKPLGQILSQAQAEPRIFHRTTYRVYNITDRRAPKNNMIPRRIYIITREKGASQDNLKSDP